MTDSAPPPPPPPPPEPSGSQPAPPGPPAAPAGERRVRLSTLLGITVVAAVIAFFVAANAADDGADLDAGGTVPSSATSAPAATDSTTTDPVATDPTTGTAPAATNPVSTTAAGGSPAGRLLDPADAGVSGIYEVADNPYAGAQISAEGDYPIDCGGVHASSAFEPQSRTATTWRSDGGNWFEVVDVFASESESAALMNAIADALALCESEGGGLRPVLPVLGSTPVDDLGDETRAAESLLGSGATADHTIFTVTRVGTLVVYTQMYSPAGEIVDRGPIWELAQLAVARATG